MSFVFGLITISVAALVAPLVYIIFYYAIKEKTYDERMAEQRKQLAMEHNMKAKSKHQQSKKTSKKVDKERSHSEKKNKVVSFQSAPGKEAKKVEVSKNNGISNTDKTDGIAISAPKKKNDKAHTKNSNTYNGKSNGDTVEDEQRIDNDNNNNSTENNDSHVASDEKIDNIDTVSSTASSTSVTNSIDHETSSSGGENSSGDNANYYGSSNESESGSSSVEKNVVIKSKYAPTNGASDNGDSQRGKANPTESHEKAQPKKQSAKQEGEGAGKSSHKTDEKNIKDSKISAKQRAEEKTSAIPVAGKVDEEKQPKDVKPLASPSKSKKVSENGAGGRTNEGVNVDCSVLSSAVQEEAKGKPDVKKETEVEVVVTEIIVEKEEFCSVGRLDKSPLLAAPKKQNGSINPVPSAGKTSPVQGAKNPRQVNNLKAAKKQTTEIKTLQKISNESNGPVNVTLLIPLIAKAELSRSEIQNLIDLLLNKQQENGTIDAEWIGSGRQDPVVKLKKQLAEKEKALAAEQEAHQAIQNKLKELRAELNVEKHANRQREETLNSRQADLQALNARLQGISDEKQNLAKQIQQLQAKLNEERLIIRSLKEENSKTKSSLQQELLSQRQQLEMHIAHLNEQHSQAIMTLDTQLAQLAARLQEQEAANAQLSDENVMLRERIAVQDNQIAHYQQSHTATQELMIQLEELRRIKTALERDLTSSQFEITGLNNELKSATEQLNRQNAEIEKFNRIVQNERIEIDELLKENARLNDQNNFTFNEKKQLQIENEKLKNQLIELREQSRSVDEIDKLENEIKNYRNTVAESNQEVARLKELVSQLEASTKQYQSRNVELEEQSRVVDELKENLKKQLEKNNEVKIKEREEVLQRVKLVLPASSDVSLSTPASLEDNVWFDYLEKVFKELRRERQVEQQSQFIPQPEENIIPKDGNVLVLDELEKQNRQLQTMVSHYKSIISDTEGMLNSLQKHVEQEENRWSEQVQILQSQLNALTEERNSLLVDKTKVVNGCTENDSSSNEQKLNNCVNKCLPLLSSSSINDMHVSS